MRLWGAILGLLLAAALGCASTDSRIAENQDAFDGYPRETQEKIRAGEIAVGFSEEQVLMSVGKPSHRSQITGEDGAIDVWTWSRSKPGFGFGIGTGGYSGRVGVGTAVTVGKGARSDDERVVEFVNGRVKRFEQLVED